MDGMYQVYLVDDDALILTEIKETVSWMDNGFEVCGMNTDPMQAIEEILLMEPDVIFCDLMMPVIDGLELITTLRERGLTGEFVMLSAYGTFENSRSFFLMKGFDYLLKPLQHNEVQLVLEKLFHKLSLSKSRRTEGAEGSDREACNPSFLEMMEYITGHYDEKFTLERLGKQFGLSPNYICNLFAKYYQTTLTRYVTDVRMKEVVRMIRQENCSFKEVASRCGYQDYFYFCKVFKQYYKESPTEYKKNHT